MAKANKSKKTKAKVDSAAPTSPPAPAQVSAPKKTKSLLPASILREFVKLEARLDALEKMVHALTAKAE